MINKLSEIVKVLSEISESIKPNLGISVIGILAPVVSAFIAVLIAYYLDKRSEKKSEKENLLNNINYILVKNDLNIRTLFSIVNNAEITKVNDDKAGKHITIPKLKIFSPLLEINIGEMKLIDIDNVVTTLIFEFRELNQILKDAIDIFNKHAELILEVSKENKLTINDFTTFNLQLDEIIKNGNAFIIRLVVLNTQLLRRAYDKLNRHDRDKLYEIEITDNLVRLIEKKKDHPEIKSKHDKILSLKRQNKLEKAFKGMEKKDVLIRIFLKIFDKN